jgi:hypothetical protein
MESDDFFTAFTRARGSCTDRDESVLYPPTILHYNLFELNLSITQSIALKKMSIRTNIRFFLVGGRFPM